MLLSRTRACTALPAMALAAALALAPVAAHAAEAPSAAAVPAPVAETTEPVDGVVDDVVPTPGAEGVADEEVADEDVAEGATSPVVVAPAPVATTPVPDAPAAPAVTPAPGAATPKAVVVDEQPQEDPFVASGSTVLHPGGLDTVYAGGFTPGDAVSLDVTGEDVDEDLVFTVTPWTVGPLTFDEDGWTGFDLAVPAEVPLGTTLTVSIADASGREASADFVTAAALPAPVLVVPDGATEGVVALPGSGAEAGNAVVVTVGVVEDDSSVWTSGQTSAVFASAEADDAEADAEGDFPYTTEPQRLDEEFGIAQAIVPVAEDGTFVTQFDLPEGEYVAYATQVDLETGDASETADPQLFTLVAAAPVVAPVPTQEPAATVVVAQAQAPRAARLAHTGQESTGWAALAAGLVLAGAGLLAAGRLRRRS